MYPRLFKAPLVSYFLFGPRGTGKSTWLRKSYPNAFWIDLLDPATLRIYLAEPERLRSAIDRKRPQTVVIDEVQRAPDLLNVVHSLIEEKRGIQFVLTGSSARKLKREGVNLLAGRALLRHMPPFFAAELGSDFSLAKNLKLGMLPIVLDSLLPKEVLQSYVAIYLKEEVQEEGIVRNAGDFARFLETMSFSHASLVNASNIAREAHIDRRTVDKYLLILNDLLLSFELSVFRRKAKRQLIAHSKLYFFDCGVYLSLRPSSVFDVESEKEGGALEGLVAQHLKGWVDAQTEPYALNFWQTGSGIEVDFIVSGPQCFLAIEVKNSTVLHPKDFRGLTTFAQNYPEAKLLLLYRGKEEYWEGSILCSPVERFLISVHPQKMLNLPTTDHV